MSTLADQDQIEEVRTKDSKIMEENE